MQLGAANRTRVVGGNRQHLTAPTKNAFAKSQLICQIKPCEQKRTQFRMRIWKSNITPTTTTGSVRGARTRTILYSRKTVSVPEPHWTIPCTRGDPDKLGTIYPQLPQLELADPFIKMKALWYEEDAQYNRDGDEGYLRYGEDLSADEDYNDWLQEGCSDTEYCPDSDIYD
jgi:hypothetical protein